VARLADRPLGASPVSDLEPTRGVMMAVADRGWRRPFDETDSAAPRSPACHTGGCRPLHHKASEGGAQAEEWQAAMEALILVATSGGPTMLARIGVMRALNRHVERLFNPSRKDHHWGHRRLPRDR
jgi:hypothetical protein